MQEQLAELEEALAAARAAAAEVESEYKARVQELQTRLQQAEHSAHKRGAQLAAARADLGVLGRDFEQSETAKGNLQKVLEQFQWEKTAELKQMEKIVREGGREGGREERTEDSTVNLTITLPHSPLPPSFPPSLPPLAASQTKGSRRSRGSNTRRTPKKSHARSD